MNSKPNQRYIYDFHSDFVQDNIESNRGLDVHMPMPRGLYKTIKQHWKWARDDLGIDKNIEEYQCRVGPDGSTMIITYKFNDPDILYKITVNYVSAQYLVIKGCAINVMYNKQYDSDLRKTCNFLGKVCEDDIWENNDKVGLAITDLVYIGDLSADTFKNIVNKLDLIENIIELRESGSTINEVLATVALLI